jgi:hypothetical protein
MSGASSIAGRAKAIQQKSPLSGLFQYVYRLVIGYEFSLGNTEKPFEQQGQTSRTDGSP